jgi:hypothetical protein
VAVPNPDKELERVRKLLAPGLPPLLVLSGPGAFFREAALQHALDAVPADAELVTVDGQDVEVRGSAAGEEADADEAEASAPAAHCPDLDVLCQKGLFFRRAFVVVRRGERWLKRYGQALALALPRLAAGSGLVLETAKLDRRTRLAKALAERGVLAEFRDLYDLPYDRARGPLEGELVQWITAQSRRLGVALTPESAWLLAEQVGKAPGELLAELARLRDQLGADPKRRALPPAALRGRLSVGFQATPFELAEAVLAGDRAAAFRALRAMFDRGVRQRDGGAMQDGGVFPFATSWLWQSLGQVLEGRLLLDAGTPLADVPGRAGVHGFVERYQQQVRANEAARLERGLLQLLHCQRERRLTGEDDVALLERFLVRWFEGAPAPALGELDA